MLSVENILIRPMLDLDGSSVLAIYKEGIETGYATFEQTVPTWKNWDVGHFQNCRLIAEINSEIVGWAALSPVSSRCVYGGVAEVSIYVGANARQKGVGKKLLNALIVQSEINNIWTLQAGIFPENKASIQLHEKPGFRIVGYREKIGKTVDGIWRDTLLLERRSKVVGT